MNDAAFQEQLRLVGLHEASASRGASAAVKRLHSKYDPWKEARAQLPQDVDPSRIVLVFGAGLGYVIRLMLDRGISVVWVETDQSLLVEGLRLIDFRVELQSGQLRIAQAVESKQIDEWRLSNKSVTFWSHRVFLTPDLAQLKGKCEFLLNRQSVNQATLARFERIWAVNLCANLITLQNGRPVKDLFGAHKGSPAVVIGAGPSLTDSLAELARARRRAVFVAVDTAVRVLSHAGIDPDYIVTVDPQPVNRVFLEGYRGKARIVLDPTVSHHTAKYAARNPVHVTATPFQLGRLFAAMLGEEPGEISFGGSVSTNAYDLARKMGCNPVFLVGQDLAFSDGQVHARGAALEERLSWKESRVNRREMHNYAQLTAITPLAVEDLRGGLSQTNGKLTIFYRWFEARFETDQKSGLKTVNCTRRGALFRSARQGSLDELKEDLPTANPATNGVRKPHSVLAAVRLVKERLESINAGYYSAWNSAKEERLAELDELGLRLRQMPELELLGNTAQSAIQRLSNAEGDEAIESLHRALHEGCDLLVRRLHRVLRILRDQEEPGSSAGSPRTPAQ
jgi:hypothetical protein